jgi:hypothetical protein
LDYYAKALGAFEEEFLDQSLPKSLGDLGKSLGALGKSLGAFGAKQQLTRVHGKIAGRFCLYAFLVL